MSGVCPCCEGRGRVERQIAYPWAGVMRPVLKFVDCSLCGGWGIAETGAGDA